MASTKIVIAGFSALCLAAVPAALALGASGWLGFTITAHGLQKTVEQEKRRAVYVGAAAAPKAPLRIEVPSGGAVLVEKADLDGHVLTAYLRNRGHERQCFAKLHWSLRAPDGTGIAADEQYVSDPTGGLQPGDREEIRVDDISEDSRGVALRLTVTSQPIC